MNKSPETGPDTVSQPLPKVGDVVARRLAVRILVASLSAMTVLAIGVALVSGVAQINAIRRDAQALSTQLARSMQFFDYAPMIGILNAFTQGRDLPGAVALDANQQVVASNLNDAALVRPTLPRTRGQRSADFYLTLDRGLPTAWVEAVIATPADLPLGWLIVAVPFGPVLQHVAMVVGGLALFAGFLLLWIARTARNEVTKSLGEVAKLTAAFNQVASLERLPEVAVTPGTIEVKSLLDAYQKMIATLRQGAVLEVDHQRAIAVAQTTQMLAHDVRKPFSILTMGLKSLSLASDPEHLRKLVDRMVPEVDRALASVNGMITDIMEIGSTATDVLCEPISPHALIEASLSDLFRLFPAADVALSYDLKHTYMVDIDSQKVLRVLLNILSNALQAMEQKGRLWFHTRDVLQDGGKFVEFCLGNDGPAIAEEHLSKLFTAFYTRGKRGGTGLGLAIVQKVIKAHGGRIECTSSLASEDRPSKVEFWFTLPVTTSQIHTTTAQLLASSQEFANAMSGIKPLQGPGSTSINHSERELEALVADMSHRLRRPLRVLVIDDEAIYRNALAAFFVIGQGNTGIIELSLAASSAQAVSSVENAAFDLVISDVDLGQASLDGFELVGHLRQLMHSKNRSALVCIHSNRIVAADHKAAADCGAHAFLPKPMARAQLLRLLLQAAQASVGHGATEVPVLAAAGASVRAEIIIVEDNVFMLEMWELAMREHAVVHALTGPAALDAKLAADPHILSRISCLVTDYHFDGSERTGADLGRLAKEKQPDLLVVLVTDGRPTEQELAGAIDRVIAKEDLDISLLAG